MNAVGDLQLSSGPLDQDLDEIEFDHADDAQINGHIGLSSRIVSSEENAYGSG